MTWQPIETAPKDGTELLLTDGRYPVVGWWREGHGEGWFSEGWFMAWNIAEDMAPTHWTPLPAPPDSA